MFPKHMLNLNTFSANKKDRMLIIYLALTIIQLLSLRRKYILWKYEEHIIIEITKPLKSRLWSCVASIKGFYKWVFSQQQVFVSSSIGMFFPFSFTHKQLSFSHHYCTVNLWFEVCQDFLLAWVERVKLMDLQMCFEMWHEDEMAFKGLSSSGQVFKSLRAHTLSFFPPASCCPGYSTKTFGLSHLTALYDWILFELPGCQDLETLALKEYRVFFSITFSLFLGVGTWNILI